MPGWLDQLLVLAAVLAAVGFFARSWVRKRRKGASCAGGCGCASSNRASNPQRTTLIG